MKRGSPQNWIAAVVAAVVVALATYVNSNSWLWSIVSAAVALPLAFAGWHTIVSNSSAPARGRGALAGSLGGLLFLFLMLLVSAIIQNPEKTSTQEDSYSFYIVMFLVGTPLYLGIGGLLGMVLAIMLQRNPRQ